MPGYPSGPSLCWSPCFTGEGSAREYCASYLIWFPFWFGEFGAGGLSGIWMWMKHTPRLLNLAVLLQISYLKELQFCAVVGLFFGFFLRITNQNEGHVSLILPKAGRTKYIFNWFELTIWLCLIEAMLLLH